MSAIAVLFELDGGPASSELLDAMLVAQRNSGPDGDSVWSAGQVALGQARFVATSGPDRASGVTSLGDRLHVTADARIDGREDLVQRLRSRGHAPSSAATDEELLLHAYACWGDECVAQLIGDFSFALWDAPRRRLLCAVDALGAKPFFYAQRGGSFCAASSVDAVRLHPEVGDELDERWVADFLVQGCASDRDASIYADVARIPPGHLLVVDAEGARLRRYFAWPEAAELGLSRHPDPVAAFRELLDEAVRDRLRTPRVAVELSGGIDSPLVASTAKRLLAQAPGATALEGFTCIYEHLIRDDERTYAEAVGDRLGIPVDFQPLDGGAFFDWVERVTPAQPLDATVLVPWLGQADRLRARFDTVLTGSDGDTLVACVPRLHFRHRWRQGAYRQCFADVAQYVVREHGPPPIGLRTVLARVRAAASVPPLPEWFEPSFVCRANLQERWAGLSGEIRYSHPREPALALINSAAWGRRFDLHRGDMLGFPLEMVHPLADLRVIRFAFEQPAVPWCVSKRLLRNAAAALPKEVRLRPKTPLSADPDVARFARGGRVAHKGWKADELARFVDIKALAESLGGPAVPSDLTQRLRALGLGFWLSQRARVRREVHPEPGVPRRGSRMLGLPLPSGSSP